MDILPVTIFEKFQSHPDGLTLNDVSLRFKKFGLNTIKGRKKTPLIIQFLGEFTDLMVLILIFAAALSYVFDEKKDATVIIAIVILNAIIGFIQKYKAEKAIEALKKLLTPKARVLRNSKEEIIEAVFVVPGDILILNEGDKVAADAVLFEMHELQIDESILTGESVPVEKNTKDIRIFMGTQVTHGTAKAIVQNTGMRTEFGKIAALTTETKKDKSPLQKELNGIGAYVGKITLLISLLLVIVGLAIQHKSFVETLVFAASVAVAAVPEGLPATVTIALALGVQRLAKKNAIIRQLASVETLGSTTVICSDKTGTLTRNEMTVKEAVFGQYCALASGSGYEPTGAIKISDEKAPQHADNPDKRAAALARLAQIAGLCNNARLYLSRGKWTMIGDPTEGALLTFAEKAGFENSDLRRRFKKIFELPFDSIRKRMTVIYQDTETKKAYAFVKGALEAILPLCTGYFTGEQTIAFDHETQKKLQEKNENMANRALRVMAFAYKEIPFEIQRKYQNEDVEKDLVFSGMTGMMDPPREGVKEAVKLTQKAGIKVYIVTGDHGLTAAAIAKELGLVKSYRVQILNGAELDRMSDEKLRALFKKEEDIIFARINPSHKLRIVSILKNLGEIVAVTGDGVNDAPAIKRADIGIAMGISGTDVTREAANMVLADDSFATIVAAIKEGRVIYENMRKFIFYVFSSNIGEIFAVFVPILLAMPPALSAILILSVNVGTDLLPALALGVDPPEADVMHKKPRDPKSRIMNRPFTIRYLFIGSFIGIVVVGGYIWDLMHGGWTWGMTLETKDPRHLASATFAFVLLIIIQMINALNARSDHQSVFKTGIFSNRKLWLSIFISVALTAAFVYVPKLQHYINATALDLTEWLVILGISLSVLFIEEFRKLLVRQKMA